jgi:subtilisin family serine protease
VSRIRAYLRKFSVFGAAILVAGTFCAVDTSASAQFRMGFARFGGMRPMWGEGRVVRGMPGRGFGDGERGFGYGGSRYGWNDGIRRSYPGYPRYPVYPRSPVYPRYPVYPVYSGYPVDASYPAERWRPRHVIAQSTTPPVNHHSHRAADHTPPVAVASKRTFAPHEVITAFAPGASADAIDRLERRYHLARLESHNFSLINSQLSRWRIRDDRPVEEMVNALRHEEIVASVQPNYVFTLQEQLIRPIIPQGDPAQYVLDKLEVEAAHRLATGKHVLVAVIDSDIDKGHPDLAGAVIKSFDALQGPAQPHEHGTAMAGAIAAHGKLLGIAPDAELLAARAFGDASGAAQGTSFAIYESLQWAADNGARIVNMSFAGPEDPMLHEMLAAAYRRNMILIAAAGNAGPQAAPLYPAADPDVIAVTATDDADSLYNMANRGSYIAIAAPGVEVLADAPGRAYEITTGTSVAAAHVSGIVALLVEEHPTLSPSDVRRILMGTAKPLGSAAESTEFGAGLANAYRAALTEASPAPADMQANQ